MCQAHAGEARFWGGIERSVRRAKCHERGHHRWGGKRSWNTCTDCWQTRREVRRQHDRTRRRELRELARLKRKYEPCATVR